jgi:hypothetical protein
MYAYYWRIIIMGYRSNEDMAEDNHSSAVVLISVGTLGLIADIYMLIKNPLAMPMFNKYMTTGIMGSLFVLFIVMGALAMRNYKRFNEAAVKESTLADKIHEWCVDNLTADTICDAIEAEDPDDDMSGDGVIFYKRTAYMKERITSKFLNLDEDMLDRFIEKYYSEIFS